MDSPPGAYENCWQISAQANIVGKFPLKINSTIVTVFPAYLMQFVARIKASPLGYRLARGAFWSLVGAVLARGLGLISSILVARMLGKTGFGELCIIQSTVGMFGTFAGFGLGLTATKFIAEYRATDPAKAGRIRGLSSAFAWLTSAITAFILYLMAPWLAEHTLAAPHLAGLLRIGTIFLFLTSINGAQTGALSGFEAFKTVAKVNLFCGLLNFPLMVGGVHLAGIPGAVWGMVISTGFNWFLNHTAIRKECLKVGVPYTYRECWTERKVLWEFSLPAVLSGISTGPLMWAASALLVNQPNGYAEMGIYNAVLRIKQVPELILSMLMTPVLPILSDQFGKKNTHDFNKTLKYTFLLSLLVVVPISLIQMATPKLTLMPFGKDFLGEYHVVQWLMLHTICVGVFSPLSSVISSLNKMWFGFATNLIWGVLYISLSYLLIPHYGATGLAAAFTLSHLINSIVAFSYINSIGKVFIVEVPMQRIVLSVTVLFGICYLSYASGNMLVSLVTGIASSLSLILAITRYGLIIKTRH